METSRLLAKFTTSVFTEMARHKQQKIREGKEIIDLSIGSPDLPPPSFVIEALASFIQETDKYGYALAGTHEFSEAVAHFYKRRYGVDLNVPDEICQLAGSQEGLVHLPLVLVNPGDVVLLPDPCYPAYITGANLAGAEVYTMPLLKENRFLPDLQAIPKPVAEKAKLMFLNFPGNPVPAMPTKAFFEEVVHFAKTYDIAVVHDFAYSELYFTDEKPISFLSVDGAKDVGVEFNSLSKSYNMAGCRIAYVVGNEKMVQALNKLKSNLDFGVFLPIQHAATKALNEGDSFLEAIASIYKKRRDILVDGLNEIGWELDKPDATMFIWAPVPKRMSSFNFTLQLLDKAGVVVTPGSAFGMHGEGYVRIGLVQKEEKLAEAVEKIKSAKML